MNQNKMTIDNALLIVNRALVNLIYFFIFGVLIISTTISFLIVNLTSTDYLLTLLFTTLSVLVVCVIMLMPFWEKIEQLFNPDDKKRRALEIIEKVEEDPNYYNKGIVGDIPKGVIENFKRKSKN